MNMGTELIITVAGGVFSVGFTYATLKTHIDALREEVANLKSNGERLMAVESKVDILINHFIK